MLQLLYSKYHHDTQDDDDDNNNMSLSFCISIIMTHDDDDDDDDDQCPFPPPEYSSVQYMDVKRAGKTHGFWTISFFRGLVGAIASAIAALLNKKRTSPLYGKRENIKWLVARGVLGGITITTAFVAVLVSII